MPTTAPNDPATLITAAVATVRRANGLKVFALPVEATEEQSRILAGELQAKHPWHEVLVIHFVTPKAERADMPTLPLEALRKRITAM